MVTIPSSLQAKRIIKPKTVAQLKPKPVVDNTKLVNEYNLVNSKIQSAKTLEEYKQIYNNISPQLKSYFKSPSEIEQETVEEYFIGSSKVTKSQYAKEIERQSQLRKIDDLLAKAYKLGDQKARRAVALEKRYGSKDVRDRIRNYEYGIESIKYAETRKQESIKQIPQTKQTLSTNKVQVEKEKEMTTKITAIPQKKGGGETYNPVTKVTAINKDTGSYNIKYYQSGKEVRPSVKITKIGSEWKKQIETSRGGSFQAAVDFGEGFFQDVQFEYSGGKVTKITPIGTPKYIGKDIRREGKVIKGKLDISKAKQIIRYDQPISTISRLEAPIRKTKIKRIPAKVIKEKFEFIPEDEDFNTILNPRRPVSTKLGVFSEIDLYGKFTPKKKIERKPTVPSLAIPSSIALDVFRLMGKDVEKTYGQVKPKVVKAYTKTKEETASIFSKTKTFVDKNKIKLPTFVDTTKLGIGIGLKAKETLSKRETKVPTFKESGKIAIGLGIKAKEIKKKGDVVVPSFIDTARYLPEFYKTAKGNIKEAYKDESGSVTQKYLKLFGVPFYSEGGRSAFIEKELEGLSKAETPDQQQKAIEQLKKKGVEFETFEPTFFAAGEVPGETERISVKGLDKLAPTDEMGNYLVSLLDAYVKFKTFAPLIQTAASKKGEGKVVQKKKESTKPYVRKFTEDDVTDALRISGKEKMREFYRQAVKTNNPQAVAKAEKIIKNAFSQTKIGKEAAKKFVEQLRIEEGITKSGKVVKLPKTEVTSGKTFGSLSTQPSTPVEITYYISPNQNMFRPPTSLSPVTRQPQISLDIDFGLFRLPQLKYLSEVAAPTTLIKDKTTTQPRVFNYLSERLYEVPKQETDQETQTDIPTIKTFTRQGSSGSQGQTTVQVPKEEEIPKQQVPGFTTITPREPSTPERTLRTARPVPLFYFPGEKPVYRRGTQVGYETFVKAEKKKNFIKVSDKPLTREGAKDLGARIVDNRVNSTFKIQPIKKTVVKKGKKISQIKLFTGRELGRGDGYFNRTSYKYRDYKVSKKRPTKISNAWIEKEKYRIDTSGERQGLSIAGTKSRIIKRRKAGLGFAGFR